MERFRRIPRIGLLGGSKRSHFKLHSLWAEKIGLSPQLVERDTIFSYPSPPFPSFSYLFFCQQVFFSIQSRAICPQSTFFIFYATLSFKAFCSWLATELLPISSENSPRGVYISRLPWALQVPWRQLDLQHVWICLPGWAVFRAYCFQETDYAETMKSTRQSPKLSEFSCETGGVLNK